MVSGSAVPSGLPRNVALYPALEVPGYFHVVPLGRNPRSYPANARRCPLGRNPQPRPRGSKCQQRRNPQSRPVRGSMKIARHFECREAPFCVHSPGRTAEMVSVSAAPSDLAARRFTRHLKANPGEPPAPLATSPYKQLRFTPATLNILVYIRS